MKEYLKLKSKTSVENTGYIETEAHELLRGKKLVFRLEFVFKPIFKIMFETMFKTVFKTMFQTMFQTMFKTLFKTMFKTMFKTVLENSKDIANKNMSFLKITDPKKRDFIVNEFLKIRQNI